MAERVAARSQGLAAESQAQLPNDPEISLILGMRAVHTKPTPQSMFALVLRPVRQAPAAGSDSPRGAVRRRRVD